MKPRERFNQGEPIVLALDAVVGDPEIVDSVTAELRRVEGGGTINVAGQPAATFTVTRRDAAPGVPTGWDLVIHQDITQELPLGMYRTDALVIVAGNRGWSDQIDLQIVQPVTAS